VVVEINLNLDALVAAAQAAISKGPEEPWFDGDAFPGYDKEDREFIAAASPQVMIDLVRRLSAAEGLAAARIEQIPTDATMLAFFCDILPEHRPEAESLVMAIQKRCGPQTLVAFFREGDNDMKALDEAAMRALGWVRAERGGE